MILKKLLLLMLSITYSLNGYALTNELSATISNNQSLAKSEDSIRQQQSVELTVLAKQIENRVSTLQLIAKSLANDSHIHAWVKNDMPKSEENILLEKLGFYVEAYNLTSASFADKTTNKYWNHEGFLRVLTPEIDTWYFAYISTTESQLISIYHDQNKKRVDLYVNYQQLPGNGLSGVATSFESVLESLRQSNLFKQGQLFITDDSGVIKVHPDIIFQKKEAELAKSIETILAQKLPVITETSIIPSAQEIDSYLIASPIANTSWYVVFEPATQGYSFN